MEFLDQLKAYLARPEARRPDFTPELAAHRRHLLYRIDELHRAGKSEAEVEHIHAEVSDDFSHFVEALGLLLIQELGEAPDAGSNTFGLINTAVDRRLGIKTSTGSRAMDLELDRIRREAASGLERKWLFQAWAKARRVQHYATEIGAVSREKERVFTTEVGKLILTLPHRDAVRWLLAVEAIQAQGPNDDWRLCRSSAAALLETPEWKCALGYPESEHPPASWLTLERLADLGLVSLRGMREGTARFALLPEGRPLLEEIAANNETPFTLLARALLQDQTAATLAGLPGAAALMQSEGAATVATRHARMVAHEIRNALVPVQAALSGLYEEVERRGQGDALATRRDRIDGGIDRMFRFVREVAQTADLTARSVELFNVALAIEGAIAGIEAELGLSIPFTREAELHPVKGSSDRFVLALRNLLRNAAQSRAEPPVQIHVTGGVNNGAEVFIRVDDDGPGVPLDNRSKIFEPGFTGRPGGSGQGLAFVREVVESEMAGRVLCEESPLGGARFVVRLPVGTKRSA